MTEITKPTDYRIWAAGGVRVSPDNDKFALGWGSELPPYQYFNYLMNKVESYVAYNNQHGLPQWDATTEYISFKSFVQGSNGYVYKCVTTNTNQDPVADVTESYWRLIFTEYRAVDRSQVSSFAMTLLDDTSASAMRTTLGFSTVGSNIITASTTSNAQSALGGTTVGKGVFTSTSQLQAQSFLGIAVSNQATTGIIRTATDGETNTGTSDVVAISPLVLKAGFAISLGTTGYIKFPSWFGGFTFQWKRQTIGSGGGSVYVAWPLEFTSQCMNAWVGYSGAGSGSAATCWIENTPTVDGVYVDHNSGSSKELAIFGIGY